MALLGLSGGPPELEDEGSGEFRRDVDAAGVLEKLFAMLPPAQAYLLEQVELGEREIGEVSQEFGWTATAGRLRLMRARRALKRVYQQWTSNERSTTT